MFLMSEMPSDSIIQDTIESILERPEFRARGESLSDYILKMLVDFFDMLFSGAEGASAMPVAIMVGLAAIVIMSAVFFVLRAKRARGLDGKKSGSAQTGRAYDSAELMRSAEDFAGRGDFGRAFACLFLAHLKSLEERGLIVIEKGKTNTQYEYELITNGYGGTRQFREFKSLFNAVRYGYWSVGADTFEIWRTYCLSSIAKGDAM